MKELAEILKARNGLRMRQGVVMAVNGDTVSVAIGGSTVAVDGVQHLNSCSPSVNDIVWIVSDGADLWIIGTHGAPPIIDPDILPPVGPLPITTATGVQPNGYTGWTKDPVTVTLTADANGGNGVEKTLYMIDGGAITEYSAPFVVSAAGSHLIRWWSVDTKGNVEPVNVGYVNILSASVVPTGLTLTPGIGAIHARWNTVVSERPVTYKVYVGSSSPPTTLVAQSGANVVTIKRANADGLTYVAVSTVDVGGNESAKCTAASATALAAAGDIANGEITDAMLGDGIIGMTKLAAGISPPRIVTGLPAAPTTDYPVGSTCVWTWDNKLYRYGASNPIPVMTGNAAPSGTASASSIYSASYDAWKAFNHSLTGPTDCWISENGTPSGWLCYDFGAGVTKVAKQYAITCRWSSSAVNVAAPKSWTLEGSNDGSAWDTLDTQTDVIGWAGNGTPGAKKVFPLANTTAYRYYRLNISASNLSSYVAVGGLEIAEASAPNVGWNCNLGGGDIDADTITQIQIAAGAVGTAEIAVAAVTDSLLADDAVTQAKIALGAVGNDELAALAVSGPKIAAGAITAAKIAAGTITANEIAADTITAAKIAALTITGNEIAAGVITAAKIAAGTITANEIAAGTITGAKIAAGTIAAGNIAAHAITAAQIAANTITASEIAADTITAGQIAAGAIGADEIAANAVVATKIAAGTIFAAHLVVANYDNLIPNPTSEQDTTGAPSGAVEAAGVSDADAFAGTKCRAITGVTGSSPSTYITPMIPVREGEQYFMSAMARLTQSAGTGARIVVAVYNAAGSVIQWPSSNYKTGTAWGTDAANPDLKGTFTIAAGGIKMRLAVQWAGSVTGQYAYFDNLFMRRMADANLIVDGCITAGKIAAGTITANEIAANTITAAKLDVSDVQAAVVTASSIAAVNISAVNITGGTISGTTITGATVQTATSGQRTTMTVADKGLRFYTGVAGETAQARIYAGADSTYGSIFIKGPDFGAGQASISLYSSDDLSTINLKGGSGATAGLVAVGNAGVDIGGDSVSLDSTNGFVTVLSGLRAYGAIKPYSEWSSGTSDDGIWIQGTDGSFLKLYYDTTGHQLIVRKDASTYATFARSGGNL